jgi:hypothetical protein
MGRGGDDPRKGLVRDGSDIYHSKVPLVKFRMEVVKRDARLRNNIPLFDIDLSKVDLILNKTKHGKVKCVPQATDLICRFAA